MFRNNRLWKSASQNVNTICNTKKHEKNVALKIDKIKRIADF